VYVLFKDDNARTNVGFDHHLAYFSCCFCGFGISEMAQSKRFFEKATILFMVGSNHRILLVMHFTPSPLPSVHTLTTQRVP